MGFFSSSSSSNGSSLSDDLVVEILARLPLKSVIRCKCVCKAWHSLISDDDDYLLRRLPLIMSAICCVDNNKDKSKREIKKKKPSFGLISHGSSAFECCNVDDEFFDAITIVDCCNGLLLCYSSISITFSVCNPITKTWIALPPNPNKSSQLSILVFDPWHASDYKVLCFTAWKARGAELEVFSSETGEWMEREVYWGIDTDTMSASMHYSAGVLYMLATDHLVCVQLDTMSCCRIALPEPLKHSCGGCIGKTGGELCFATGGAAGEELRVWMLQEDLESGKWVLKHSGSSSVSAAGGFEMQGFHPELEVVYVSVAGKLVGYDFGRKRSEVVLEMLEKQVISWIQICLFPFSRHFYDCLRNC